MLPSLLPLVLAALQGFTPARTAPNPSPLLGSNWGSPRRYVHLHTSSDVSNFYLEISHSGHVRRSASRSPYSVVVLKTETRDRLAIYGVKSNRYLCMDREGKPFSSSVCHREDCLFHHKLLENHHDVYYSCKSGLVLNLEGAKLAYSAGRSLPASSLFLSEKSTLPLEQLLHRERRNRQVDPADPLRVHGNPREGSDSLPYLDDELEPEEEHLKQIRAVSRESPGSILQDDPLHVLMSISGNSPRHGSFTG